MNEKQFPEPEDILRPDAPETAGEAAGEEGAVFEPLSFRQEPQEEEPVIDELSFADALEEEAPVIRELTMMDELPVEESISDAPVETGFSDAPVCPVSEEDMPEADTAEEPAPQEPVPEDIPEEEEPQPIFLPDDDRPFMERIPDVDEDYPDEDYDDLVVIPEDPVEMPPDIPEEVIPSADPLEETEDHEYRDNSDGPGVPIPSDVQTDPADNRPRIPRKGRPKRKKGEGFFGIPNILATFVWLGLILAIGVTAGRMLWVCAADVLAFGREDRPVTITIYEADTIESITDKLYDAGLIRYKSLFSLYASISDAEEDIKPGIYDLNTRYDYHALVNFMTPRSNRQVIELTIPEGYTCRQIFALLEESKICTAVDIAAYAATGELNDYWFLEGVERGSEYCLEGYLFPDTYEFYKNSTPREALQKMLNNFENRFSEEMRAQIDALNANVTGGNYGVREVTIVASLIEKESSSTSESPAIAGVIYNRLFRWDGVPAYLNIDASIVYAQGGEADVIDTDLDSPYNTYTHVGLTPGPIANPGLASLKAALEPEHHDYYYYVLNPSTGKHQFSSTLAEHEDWIQKFREG